MTVVMGRGDIVANAQALVAPARGILAADESAGTIEKRLAGIAVDSTEENRRGWRELLFSAAGAAQHISGAILFDETLRQSARNGEPFPQLLERQGILPGIKVDKGAKALAGAPGEKVTEGLDGLRERLREYAELGALFTKWRAVIAIGDGIPSPYCIEANAHALARFAALSQETGLVPIVEPEVLMDGDHDIERCREATEATLLAVFEQLSHHRVVLEGALLKPNMVLSGTDCPRRAGVEEVAKTTLEVLLRQVPEALPGIVFLSGGQSEVDATRHLNAMNAMGPQPWQLSFSYGRALQRSALEAWGGEAANVAQAQAAYGHRARMNGLARSGAYRPDLEQEGAG